MKRGGRMRGRGRGQSARKFIEPLMKVKPFETPEINNINMELDLLRQKREMIEQQQNILKSQIKYSQQRQYELENPRYFDPIIHDSPEPSRSVQDFARYYDDPVQDVDFIPLSAARKRPANAIWSRGSSPKRSGPQRSNVVESFGSRLGPKPTPQPPNIVPNLPLEELYRATAPKSRKRANPDTQLAELPIKKAANKDREAYTLREDREPSTGLNGLLELGLGSIIKQLKEKYQHSQKYNRMVTREYYTRRTKKIVRQRIRQMMMNKYIDNFADIVTQYRQKFPESTDEELMIMTMNNEVPDRRIEDTLGDEAPRTGMPCPTFFKKKMRQYVGAKLRKMFKDIHEMYNPPVEDIKKEPTETENTGGQTDEANNGENKNKVDVIQQKKQSKQPKWKINIATLVDTRLSSVIGRYIPTITAILNMDPEYIATKASWLAATMKMDPSVSGEVVIGGADDKVVEMAPIVVPKPTHYYAKVLGAPNLPQRKVMRAFLDQFCPLHTKTHKKVKNLLIVTFNNKENFGTFLAQDGVTVGESTLDIKISGKVNTAQSQNNGKEDIDTKIDNQESVDSNDKNDISISSDLDNQINDLLSSIRRNEENTADNEENTENLEKPSDSANEQNESCSNEPATDNDELITVSNEVEQSADTNDDQVTHNNEPNIIEGDNTANDAITTDQKT